MSKKIDNHMFLSTGSIPSHRMTSFYIHKFWICGRETQFELITSLCGVKDRHTCTRPTISSLLITPINLLAPKILYANTTQASNENHR